MYLLRNSSLCESVFTLQVKALSPECVIMCLLRLAACVKVHSHCLQLNTFSPVWTSMCCLRWALKVNECAHILQTWNFSPPLYRPTSCSPWSRISPLPRCPHGPVEMELKEIFGEQSPWAGSSSRGWPPSPPRTGWCTSKRPSPAGSLFWQILWDIEEQWEGTLCLCWIFLILSEVWNSLVHLLAFKNCVPSSYKWFLYQNKNMKTDSEKFRSLIFPKNQMTWESERANQNR